MARFMSDLVGNPEERLSRDVAAQTRQSQGVQHFYAPNFEKVGSILVSTFPYLCMYVCM